MICKYTIISIANRDISTFISIANGNKSIILFITDSDNDTFRRLRLPSHRIYATKYLYIHRAFSPVVAIFHPPGVSDHLGQPLPPIREICRLRVENEYQKTADHFHLKLLCISAIDRKSGRKQVERLPSGCRLIAWESSGAL